MVSKLLVFVLGAPGAGKGTQSELILKEYDGWSHISAGDLLRAQVQAGTEVGKQAAEYLKQGLMVPGSMIIGLLDDALTNGPHTKVLVDGFPRVLEQLHDFEQQVGPCSKTLFYNVPEEVARQRLLQRGENSGRVDDNAETIRTRFKVFESESMPVIEALREMGKVAEIDASAPPEQVFAATKLVVEQLEQQFKQQQEQTPAAAADETMAAMAVVADEPLPAAEPTPAGEESETAVHAAAQEDAAVDESAAAEASTLAAAAEPAAEAVDVVAAAAAAASALATENEAGKPAVAAGASTATAKEQPPAESSGVEPAAEASAREAVDAAEPPAAAAEQVPVAAEPPAEQAVEGAFVEAESSATEQMPAGLPAPAEIPAAEVAVPAATAMAAAAAEVSAPADVAAAASSAAAEPAPASVVGLQMDLSGIRTPIVICGPSGVGKGTLINKLMQQYPDRFGFSVSHTTRAPRPGEQHGVHYYFTDPSAMKPQIEAGMFLEHAEVHGNMYGTSLAAVARVSSEGRHCVLDIDVQGAQLVKASALGSLCVFIFVAPPSHDELEQRLRNRGTEAEETVLQRLANAKAEIAKAEEPGLFDHVLVNGDLEVAFYQLQLLINQRVPGLLPEVLTQPAPQPAAAAQAAGVHDSAVAAAPVEPAAVAAAAAAPVASSEMAAPAAATIAPVMTAAAVAAAPPTAELMQNGTAQHAAVPAAAVGGTSTLLDFGFGASAGPAVAVKGMPVRQYMDVTVIPVLREGLKALNSARPDDPWQFLADYLVAHKPVAH